jgi:transcription termination factor Rho
LPSKKNSPPGSDALPFGAGTFDAPPDTPARAPAEASGEDDAARPGGRRGRRPAAARATPERPVEAEPAHEAPASETHTASAPDAGTPGADESRERRGSRRRRGGRGRGRNDRGPTDGGARAAHAPERDELIRAAPGDEPGEERDDFEGDERADGADGADGERMASADDARPGRSDDGGRPQGGPREGPVDPSAPPRRSGRAERRRRWQERRRRRRLGLPLDELAPPGGPGAHGGHGESGSHAPASDHARSAPAPHAAHHGAREGGSRDGGAREAREPHEPRGGHGAQAPRREEMREVEGMLVLEKANHGELRLRAADYLPSKDDVHVAPWQVQKFALRDGAIVKGRYRRGQGRSRWELVDVLEVDGKDPREVRNVPAFKSLVTIDPDFHYALGDGSGEVSLKVVDVICPIGRGQRGIIVAPPRSGKTILLRQIAKAMEDIYPDVHLMVLLVDERPEEATEWKRSVTKGEVFVSTNDEPAKKHVELAEIVWRRARRLVELGQDVVLLIDSLTRLGRAANNVWGTSGKTMSGGIDTRALERPKALFGSARNTEKAGSLTILATTLIDTGSKMDQYIFEEFKGTGNMELVLSRKLADRRIFPAIDLERSGTRKDEKLHSAKRLARCNTLRRVLMRMHFAEAMELLITKLEDVDKIDDFLQRFDVDPDAGDEGKQAVSPVRMRW